jgi:hypothetical protein
MMNDEEVASAGVMLLLALFLSVACPERDDETLRQAQGRRTTTTTRPMNDDISPTVLEPLTAGEGRLRDVRRFAVPSWRYLDETSGKAWTEFGPFRRIPKTSATGRAGSGPVSTAPPGAKSRSRAFGTPRSRNFISYKGVRLVCRDLLLGRRARPGIPSDRRGFSESNILP